MIFDPKNDDMFKDAAYSMSLMTALVEACEWDEERALVLFDSGFRTLVNLYEYSKYDDTLVNNKQSYEKLMRENISIKMTDAEFGAVLKLLDNEVNKRARKELESI